MHEDSTLKRLRNIVFDGEKNVIDCDQYYKWQEFKEKWPGEDKIYWENLLKKISKSIEGKRTLNTPLSHEEEAWIIGLLNRAIDNDIFQQ